ncbi:hypothetical protein M673_12380 [Aureimonas sp. AU20]|nr:hypothetical protein M673_12380 [Aureimonas sp. AU20]
MGFDKNGTWVLNTLGDIIETGGTVSAYCGDRLNCGRTLDLDVYDLVMQLGRRWKHIETKPPLKCAHCGCREIQFIFAPDTRRSNAASLRELPPGNFRSSRTEAEREALALLFPRRWDWPAKGGL